VNTPTSSDGLEIHLVAHTHWDREWYRPAVQFQQRLVALIDELLDGPPGMPFLLDGQTVVLDDYLALRPERASEVAARLRAGALEAGPWYVLPDELIPSDEALVRNLLAGRRTLRRLRATPPPVLYCPDSFGHPAALATLALGFGFPLVIVWRGYGGRRWPNGDVVRFRAPDGSTALLYHLPPSGYEAGSHLPSDDTAARTHAAALRGTLGPRSSLGVVLLPHGADHHAPQPDQSRAIAALERELPHDTVLRSSLGAFAAGLVDRAAARHLPIVEGDLRDSYGYAWTLQGTLGARATRKRENALVERLLIRDVEPWAALAHLRDRRSRRHLLEAAWKPLLLSHPHDTLCGCTIDEVARAVEARLDESRAAAEGVRDDAIDVLLGHDAVAARERRAEWTPVVVLRNRTPRRRSGVAEIELDIVLGEAPVGPGSAGAASVPRGVPVVSLGAKAVPQQVLARARQFVREESPRHYPRNRLVERRRILAWVEAVPAYGLRTLPVVEGARRRRRPPETARAGDGWIENNLLRIDTEPDGLTVVTSDGRSIADVLSFVAEGEAGDLYTQSAIAATTVGSRLTRKRTTSRGPLRAELLTRWELEIPERRLTTAAGAARVSPSTRARIDATVEIDAGAPFVRIRLASASRLTDVRLRARVRTDVAPAGVLADAAFGPVARHPLSVPDEDRAMEHPPSTAPLHRYVTLHDRERGCTVYSDGLAEYEVADGSVLVTLARAVGELSRGDLRERPGHAAWPVETPGAQSLTPWRAMLALFPHGPLRAGLLPTIEGVADEVLLPLIGHTWRTALAPPELLEGAQLVGRGLAYGTIKESEDGEWTVLRCVNLLNESVMGAWRVPNVRESCLARLDETPLGARVVQSGVIAFEAPPRGVVTFLAR
jgi:hypothetical protein